MILLALGGFGAARMAVFFEEPFIALGYLLSGFVLFAGGIRHLFASPY